jgi:hypothetical protein
MACIVLLSGTLGFMIRDNSVWIKTLLIHWIANWS